MTEQPEAYELVVQIGVGFGNRRLSDEKSHKADGTDDHRHMTFHLAS